MAEAAGLGFVLLLEVSHRLTLGVFGGEPGKSERFPGEEVALAEAIGLEGFGVLGFRLRLCQDPVCLALLVLGLGVQFSGFHRRFAACQLNFILQAGLPEGPQGGFAPFGDRVGDDGTGREGHCGKDTLVGGLGHGCGVGGKPTSRYPCVRSPVRKPFREVRLAPSRFGGCFDGMSLRTHEEGSTASLWWDKFANFSWRTDWTQVVIIALLSTLGVIAIDSAGSFRETSYARSQVVFMALGWLAYWIVSSFDYRRLRVHARPIYAVGIMLLVPVSVCAFFKFNWASFIRSINGAYRWMDFGYFSIQPSEFAKVSALIFIAALLARHPIGSFRATWLTVLKVAGAALLPFGLIFVQPDLGSALIYLPLSFALLFVAGLSSRFFMVAGLASLLLVAVVAVDLVEYAGKVSEYSKANPDDRNPAGAVRGKHEATAWFFLLKDYQRERLLSFVAPAVVDPRGLGATWNVKQAVIAVGRGGLAGQGVGKGTQARFGYLPEAAAHNDFLFSGMAEEIGFAGGLLVIAGFALLFWRVVRTAARAADRFGSLLALGAATILGTHVVINIGMNIDLMPVTGVPLPFLSYGGSFVLSCFLLLGLVQSVHRHSASGGDHEGSPATGLTA